MPAAVVAIASAAAGTVAATAAFGAITAASSLGTVLAFGAVSAATSMVTSAVLGKAFGLDKAKQQDFSPPAQAARGVIVNTAATNDPIPVIYGKRRIGGTRCLLEVSGSSNEYLHIILAHCEGEIAGIDAWYLDNTPVTDARFSGLVTTEAVLGASGQSALAALVSALPDVWTETDKLDHTAYSYLRLKYSPDAFHGLPTLAADVRGRKVYDPRDGLTKYSNNPALCIRDYLINTRFGRGIPAAEIDDAAIIAAANYCDATITTPTGSQPRYTCNIILGAANSLDNLQALLTTCRGMLIFAGGKYRLVLDKPEIATFDFNVDNIVGGWQISLGGKRGRYNRVRAHWIDPANDWQPAIHVADSTAFRTADNGLMLETQLDLDGTTNSYEAQMLAGRYLRQSRFGATVQFTATIAGALCECGDVVTITHDTPGWEGKAFRVTNIALLNSDEVQVTATEYDDAVYADDPLVAPSTAPATNLPDPWALPTPTVSSVSSSGQAVTVSDGSSTARIRVAWLPPADAFVRLAEIEYRRDSGAWAHAVTVPADQGVAYVGPVEDGEEYEVRIRFVNALGVHSPWATPGEHVVAAVPSDVAPLLARLQGALGEDQLVAELATPIAMIPGHQADLRKLNRSIDATAEAALNAALKLAEVDSTMTDAGIVIDHDTGEVYIYGVRESERRLSSAEIRLDGAEANINLKASVTYVDQAIATAVIDPSQIAALDDIYLRLTTAEVDIDGAQASIALKANSITVDGINDRLVTAEGEIDVLQGQIVLKAATTTVDAIDARLNTAETTLNTIDGASIVQSAASLRQLRRSADAVAEASLAGLLFADRNITALSTAHASAKNELYAHTNDSLAAEAGARLTLAAQVEATAAALTVEQTTRVSADSANASSISTLQARLDTGDFATVKTTAEANANALGEVEAKWGVQVQTMADGKRAIAGITLLAGSDGETVFAVLADKLLIYKPDGTGVPKQIVTLGTVNGQTALGLDGNLIIDGSIVARHLNVDTLSAIAANIGTVTAGRLQNSGNTNYINLDATGAQAFLKVSDKITISADGEAVFDGVVLSRQLIEASGTVLAGQTLSPGSPTVSTVVDTGVVVPAWFIEETAKTYQGVASPKGGPGGGVTFNAYNEGFTPYPSIQCTAEVIHRWNWTGNSKIYLRLTATADFNGNGNAHYLTMTGGISWGVFKIT